MDDLAAFLKARLDEDESQAWAIHDVKRCDALLYAEDMGDAAVFDANCDCGRPARVLREVAAKRAILADWEETDQHRWNLPDGVREGRDEPERERDDGVASTLDDIIAILAAVYSDHPDYRPEWGPSGG